MICLGYLPICASECIKIGVEGGIDFFNFEMPFKANMLVRLELPPLEVNLFSLGEVIKSLK